MHDPTCYTSEIRALDQPTQLIQSELNAILNCPAMRASNSQAFEDFFLDVSSLAGMLSTLDDIAGSELH